MFDWLKGLFGSTRHPGEKWVQAKGLNVTVDIGTGELHFGDGTSTGLGQHAATLSCLGPPDKCASNDCYNYEAFSLFINAPGQLIEYILVDFMEVAQPRCLLNGRPIELSKNTCVSDVIALMGPPRARIDEDDDEYPLTTLEYRIREGVYSEWSFENDKLTEVDLANYGEDDEPAEPVEQEEEGW